MLCFSCTRIHDKADQKLFFFWRGPKIFGGACSLVRSPPPIRFAPPHIMAQHLGVTPLLGCYNSSSGQHKCAALGRGSTAKGGRPTHHQQWEQRLHKECYHGDLQFVTETQTKAVRSRLKMTSAPKSAFSCGPGGGEKLFDPGASGRKGQECPREIRTKMFMFMLLFLP